MRVVIAGAGIVGVTSAWRLMRDGHEVTLLERGPGPASETSWGNAGLISTGHAFAWGSWPALWSGLKGLTGRASGFRVLDLRDPGFWRWALRFAAECPAVREAANTRAKHLLCLTSQAALMDTLAETGLDVPLRRNGVIYLYRDQAALERAARMSSIMRDNGQDVRLLNAVEILDLDAGLAPLGDGLKGGLLASDDMSGSCHAFSSALCSWLQARGLEVRFGVEVMGLTEQGGRVTGVWTDAGGVAADAVVVALGPDAAPFLAGHGLSVPIYPIKGHSLHITDLGNINGPRLDGVDKGAGIAWRQEAGAIRLTTGADFAGYDRGIDSNEIARLSAFAQRILPAADPMSWRAQGWAGFRPMTPKGLPVVRQERPGLWLNIGHGHMGWTMAHATAMVLADGLAGRTTRFDLSRF